MWNLKKFRVISLVEKSKSQSKEKNQKRNLNIYKNYLEFRTLCIKIRFHSGILLSCGIKIRAFIQKDKYNISRCFGFNLRRIKTRSKYFICADNSTFPCNQLILKIKLLLSSTWVPVTQYPQRKSTRTAHKLKTIYLVFPWSYCFICWRRKWSNQVI